MTPCITSAVTSLTTSSDMTLQLDQHSAGLRWFVPVDRVRVRFNSGANVHDFENAVGQKLLIGFQGKPVRSCNRSREKTLQIS